ncbi:MAG: PKD domain-containing protein [Steroidobacteraceae bacterium]|jgi:alpha-galactosidase
MNRWLKSCSCVVLVAAVAGPASASAQAHSAPRDRSQVLGSMGGTTLTVSAYADGTYSIAAPGIPGRVLRSDVEAVVDSDVLRSTAYPQHTTVQSEFQDELGSGSMLTVTHSGLPGRPDLVCVLRLIRDQSWGEITVKVQNTTNRGISVQSIRSLHATDAPVIDLNGPASADRILSDSYSEDRPELAIRELGRGPHGVHRAVGSQLIYNRSSGESLFLGALTSDRLLTIFHLKERTAGARPSILSYEADATGTTEILKGESLKDSPAAEQVELSLRVSSGESLASERLMFAVGSDYHAQLEQYGRLVALLHKARVGAATPIGWWSWTAYYFGLNQGSAGTNADWLAENLKQLGYVYYQIDEGYQYARGEYTTADAKLFPLGIGYIADRVRHDGLTFGLWTAPFEVSQRAWVFQNHKEWLLHNAAGQLIHIGYVTETNDPLYVLDMTNPGAQSYLMQTYRVLYNWGVRFIKMDFMDDTAVEGSYFRPNTTALEAQRIGLKIIRSAVGESVVLDKDGSPMLNPVGIVDAGRISQDTGHSFEATRDAASGIAARYYMNRNFFIADPDAFTVSTQTVDDQSWHGGRRPLTLDEAKVSIALAAVSGGMFEIGDDLPTLGASPERLSLVKNADLIDMARLGRASTPVDLMTYAPSDRQPSVFLLKEDAHQSMLTIFNWTDEPRTRAISLAQLGLKQPGSYKIVDVFGDQSCCGGSSSAINLVQQPHSVRMLKLIDDSVAAIPPPFEIRSASSAGAGETVSFKAAAASAEAPVLACHWDFGDGSTMDGAEAQHAFTHAGVYEVQATVTGLDAVTNRKTFTVSISGDVPTRFEPSEKRRVEPAPSPETAR